MAKKRAETGSRALKNRKTFLFPGKLDLKDGGGTRGRIGKERSVGYTTEE